MTDLRPETWQSHADTRAFLSHGIDLSGEQATKTKQALQTLSRRLRASNRRTT